MMMSVQARIGMPMEDFIRLYDEQPFELINGERIRLMPTVAGHGEALKCLYLALATYEQARSTIVVYSELPFVLSDSPDWVEGSRVPDLMAFTTERIRAYKTQTPLWQGKPFVLVPDLCAEVISPNDSYLDVAEKVERYLTDGVRRVWVINPRMKNVAVHAPSSKQVLKLDENDVLEDRDLLPGFALPVSKLFDVG
jgi:Uma2 family endonuclease